MMRWYNMPNRLINETSPYLLQHAHNPVDWYAWGPEALERSAREDKLILLSIGYSACHWCHVMEHESFEDPSSGPRRTSGSRPDLHERSANHDGQRRLADDAFPFADW
jgi:hypothetical protein